MNPKRGKFVSKARELLPWAIGALVVLSSNLAASGFLETFEVWASGERGIICYSRIAYIASFFIALCLLYWQRRAFLPPRTRLLANEPAEHRKHLVLFLSNLPDHLAQSAGIPDGLMLSNDLEQDLLMIEEHKRRKPLDPIARWSWEMPLRAIREHLGVLESVTLICSRESLPQAPLFLSICGRYRQLEQINFDLLAQDRSRPVLRSGRDLPALDSCEGWDFESFDQLSRALWTLLKKFRKRKYPDDEIMIDFTGGQKVTSIVAATMTFNRQIKAQYVQTNDPWRVLSYDVVYATTDTTGLGP